MEALRAVSTNHKRELVDTYVGVLAFGRGSSETWVSSRGHQWPWELVAHSDWLIINTLYCLRSLPSGMASQINWHSNPIHGLLLRETNIKQEIKKIVLFNYQKEKRQEILTQVHPKQSMNSLALGYPAVVLKIWPME